MLLVPTKRRSDPYVGEIEMIKVLIPFQTIDGKQKSQLVYRLHDHSLARRWMTLVKTSQKFGSTYEGQEVFFGSSIFPLNELLSTIEQCLDYIKVHYPSEWGESRWDSIRNQPFPAEQNCLNIAHVLFEEIFPLEKAKENPDHTSLFILSRLNRTIHRVEAFLSKMKGFFIEANLTFTLMGTISPEENQFFSVDRKWGELYLSYCHVGESYLQIFAQNYPAAPVPQTQLSGNIVLAFQEDAIFGQQQELQAWLNHYYKKMVNMKEIPLGSAPLATLEGNWSAETIDVFFRTYPVMGSHIIFEEER